MHTGIGSFFIGLRKLLGTTGVQASPRPHPRLFLQAGEETAVRASIGREPLMREAYSVLKRRAEEFLDEKPSKRVLRGKRLLPTSQAILKRIFCLSLMYRLDSDRRYAGRAAREMMAVMRFFDWHPSHYLDTAEITMAMAIGYDWLYDFLTPLQRMGIRRAIVTKGLLRSLERAFWNKKNNWNNVCCAGVVAGSTAVYEYIPWIAPKFISMCIDSNRKCMESEFEGASCIEGINYWAYAANFQTLLFSALERSFTEDLSFFEAGDYLRSARTAAMLSTPAGHTFTYYDSEPDARFLYAQLWLAKKSSEYSLLYPELKKCPAVLEPDTEDNRLMPMLLVFGHDIIWSHIQAPAFKSLRCEGKVPVFVYRSGWDRPDDTYLAVKGGRAADNHGHIDAGSFVFESDSVRWAVDLGKENYYSLEEAGVELFNPGPDSGRWDVFRLGARSHNILLYGNGRPSTEARISFLESSEYEGNVSCKLDMAPFYEDASDGFIRSFGLDSEGNLTVCDSFGPVPTGTGMRWAMCTEASAVIIDGRTIKLSSGGNERLLKVDTAYHASAFVTPARPNHAYETPNDAFRMVGFELTATGGSVENSVKVHISRIGDNK